MPFPIVQRDAFLREHEIRMLPSEGASQENEASRGLRTRLDFWLRSVRGMNRRGPPILINESWPALVQFRLESPEWQNCQAQLFENHFFDQLAIVKSHRDFGPETCLLKITVNEGLGLRAFSK